VSRSYDATTHFESTTEDVLDLYRRIVGEELMFDDKPV
jgi:Rab GDP dissociation inhibitor